VGKALLPGLIRLTLRHDSPEVRLYAIRSFDWHYEFTPQAFAAWRRALNDRDARVRLHAARHLHHGPAPGYGPAVLVATDVLRREEDDGTWWGAAMLLGDMGQKAAAAGPHLMRSLDQVRRRADAADALVKILPAEEFDRRVFPKVRDFLQTTEDDDEVSKLSVVLRLMGPRGRQAGPRLCDSTGADMLWLMPEPSHPRGSDRVRRTRQIEAARPPAGALPPELEGPLRRQAGPHPLPPRQGPRPRPQPRPLEVPGLR
jgi:hypothetical protein